MSLYKLVTTENVDLNYKAFKKDELIDCILNLRTTYFRLKKENEENKELKKQLEKKYSKIGTLTNEVLYEENTKLINQQKEFIEYLENMLDNENDIFSVVRVKDVLSKYKEIIGGKDENKIF